MLKIMMITFTSALLALGSAAHAAPNDHGKHAKKAYGKHMSINQRQQNQSARIRAGKRDGSLTRHEVKQLRKQQRRIKRLERHFRSDGRFTKVERRQIQKRLDRASRNIRAQRHDSERRRYQRQAWHY